MGVPISARSEQRGKNTYNLLELGEVGDGGDGHDG